MVLFESEHDKPSCSYVAILKKFIDRDGGICVLPKCCCATCMAYADVGWLRPR